MTIYTCLPKFFDTRARKLDAEYEIAQEIFEDMSPHDMHEYLNNKGESRLLFTFNKIANTIDHNWLACFSDAPSIKRVAKEITRRCKHYFSVQRTVPVQALQTS